MAKSGAPEARFDWDAHARRMREAGLWQGRTVDDILNDAVTLNPDKRALIAYRADAGTDQPIRTITFGELGDMVDRAAGSLRKLGIGKGDVVGLMLPNWWEFAVASYAVGRVGAVVNPLMHIFRERELRFMLGFADTKAIVIPKTFRGFDFPAMLDGLKPELPALEQIIIVDDDGARGFVPLLLESGAAPVRYGDPDGLDPGDLALLMYTSGTTGMPKGVMHPAETLLACCKALGDVFGLTSDDIHHAAMPFGHMNGYLAVMLQALYFGSTLTLQDVWDGRVACEITAGEKITHMSGATPLLADMCRAVENGAPAPRIRTYLCGGAQIPPKVIEDAWRLLGTGVSSLWGMTETLSGTLTEPARAMEKSVTTDGRPVEGVEVLIVDDDMQPLPTGTTGRLLARGSQLCMGYYKRPDLWDLPPEGWFDTGDMAYVDAEGYIRIDGRTKDIIIRGGENVPVLEIENILHRHPAIDDIALVGFPDERLGERGCAFVVLKDGASLDLSGLQDWMAQAGAARQYWPEQIALIDTMPRNPSGKIQKFILRDQAKKFAQPS